MSWRMPGFDSGSGGTDPSHLREPRNPYALSLRTSGHPPKRHRHMICTWCVGLLGLVGVIVAPLEAQTIGTPASRIAFEQIAPDLATAQSYVYRYYPDGSATGTVLAVTCEGSASPFLCNGAIPAFTPGPHSLTLTASNGAGESPKSAPLSFTFVVIPATPQNPRIQ
jgi:hypothetical protein